MSRNGLGLVMERRAVSSLQWSNLNRLVGTAGGHATSVGSKGNGGNRAGMVGELTNDGFLLVSDVPVNEGTVLSAGSYVLWIARVDGDNTNRAVMASQSANGSKGFSVPNDDGAIFAGGGE